MHETVALQKDTIYVFPYIFYQLILKPAIKYKYF